ncbi:ABC transporter permease [Candidatus Merdisoma sp. HCP28S3_D10]|uniref:ABC transporter permease n=1 Tax=unclassified Candidatus Merdisoma TaxID=3099611 RepID=UPI003F8A09C9
MNTEKITGFTRFPHSLYKKQSQNLAAIATNALGYAAKPSVGGIVFSVTFSILIGVFFGYYPANKAAKMNPIEALRYE